MVETSFTDSGSSPYFPIPVLPFATLFPSTIFRLVVHSVHHFTAGRTLILPSVAYDRDPRLSPTYRSKSDIDHRSPWTLKNLFHQYRSPVLLEFRPSLRHFLIWPTYLLPYPPPSCFAFTICVPRFYPPVRIGICPILSFQASSPPPPVTIHDRHVVVLIYDRLVIMIRPNDRGAVLIPVANLVDRRAFIPSLPPYPASL
jgi:hypothetical protein